MVVEVPKKLGKYHILELIAQGGMAEVYKAKSIGIAGFEKILAVKRIKPQFAGEPRFIRNFVDEARIAVSLNHRNIVQVFDFGKSEGELFLAMELLEGVDLRIASEAAKKKGKRIPAELCSYILADIAAGLDYAHRKCDSTGTPLGIVHCDVSPHNILLSTEGFVKILDFGVARARFIAAPTSKRLRGKPRYMAPEQTFGESPTPASDVFVIGILAWELFVGRQLFDGTELMEILNAVREAEVEDLATLRPDLPNFLTNAVMQALQKHPKRRCTASFFATQLSRAARELSSNSSAGMLAKWLRDTFPPPLDEEDTQTSPYPQAVLEDSVVMEPSSGTKFAKPMETSELRALPEEDTEVTTVGSDIVAPDMSALIDKRRVVVAVLLLEGGKSDRLRELVSSLCDLAYKRGAVIHDRSESEVVAIFGLEMAGEDDVANAMHFAIDAGELARDATDPGDVDNAIALRSAARSGVVAQRKGSEYQLRGDSLREARDLARGAEANRPLLSGGTGRSASAQFRFRELPARRYRSRRLQVLELMGPQGHDDRARALRDRRGRFVGRRSHLKYLSEVYASTIAGCQQQGVLVRGAIGVGKSRLLSEFISYLDTNHPDALLITIAATERATDTPFTVVINYLQAVLSLGQERGEHARALLIQTLRQRLREKAVSPEWIRKTCEVIETVMELRDGTLHGQVNDAPIALRERCIASIRLCHSVFTKGAPSVLIIENVHLIDSSSLEILRSLLKTDKGSLPSLVLMSCRKEFQLPGTEFNIPELILGDLGVKDRNVLITDRLGDSSSDELVSEVARRTGGNPLYIEEVCRNIRDVGWEKTPSTVQDTVIERIDRLSMPNRAILQRAAVIGADFRALILEELVGASISSHLQELVEEGLLVRRDQAEHAADGGEFSFRHGLIQEVVYASLSAGARQTTHAQLGQLLSLRDNAGRDEPAVITARHLELGGLLVKAARYWTQAGRVAMSAFEVSAGCSAFDKAIALHAKQNKEQQHSSREQHKMALFGRAEALHDLGDYDKEGADLMALEPLCKSNPADMAKLQNQIADRHLRNGAFERAISTAQNALQFAQKSGHLLAQGIAHRIMGEAEERIGHYEKGLELVEKALILFENHGSSAHESRARISIARNFLARAQYLKAQQMYIPIIEGLDENYDPWIERLANNHLSVIHLCLGEFENAMECAQKSVRLCEEDHDDARCGDNTSICGTILSHVGQFHEARKHFQKAKDLLVATKSRWGLADCLVYHGANEAALGKYTTALKFLKRAFSEATELDTPYIRINARIAEAGVYLLRRRKGDTLLARKVAREASYLAQKANLPGSEAMALSRWAESTRGTDLPQALKLSDDAIELLLKQQIIEGPEEEIFYKHYQLLETVGSMEAETFLGHATREVQRKLASLKNPEWRQSFSQSIAINAAVLAAKG